MRILLSFILILFYLLTVNPSLANEGNKSIDTTREVQEKLYVQTDKDYYLISEVLWFKIYCVDAATNYPLNVSKIAYVEILDSANNSVLSAKIILKNASGNGSFYIPESLGSGKYKLKAYTNWMKNFSQEDFFEKTITLINVHKNDFSVYKTKANSYSIQFMPEGGNMVANLKSKVAFKATTSTGVGYDFEGILLENQDTLFKFYPTHNGMGYFYLTPKADHKYTALVKIKDGKNFTQKLQEPFLNGSLIHVSKDNESNLKVEVKSTENEKKLFLLVHTRGNVKIFQPGSLYNHSAVFNFNTALLEPGISNIILMDENKKPLCERLFFKYPENLLNINISQKKNIYTKRDSVDLTIQTHQNIGDDLINLGMSVYKIDSLQTIDKSSIGSYLYLSSDLKGKIQNADYYFSTKDEETNNNLDLIMLTHGWRRYKWETYVGSHSLEYKYLPEYNGPIISGRAVDIITGSPLKNKIVYLSSPNIFQFNTAATDSNGNFNIEINGLAGNNTILTQVNDPNNRNTKALIDNSFVKHVTNTDTYSLLNVADYPYTIKLQNISTQVQKAYSSTKINNTKPIVFDSTSFWGSFDYHYDLDNYTRFTSIEEILREYVSAVFFKGKSIFVFDSGKKYLLQNEPLNLLDGVPQLNISQFFDFDPLKIKSLDIIAKPYVIGNIRFDGVLSWKTYSPDPDYYTHGQNITSYMYEGVQPEREFYSPVYDSQETIQSHLPDFRNVLAWFPNLNIHMLQSQNIKFYTSDLPGTYVIKIEGITNKGSCGSTYKIFEVK